MKKKKLTDISFLRQSKLKSLIMGQMASHAPHMMYMSIRHSPITPAKNGWPESNHRQTIGQTQLERHSTKQLASILQKYQCHKRPTKARHSSRLKDTKEIWQLNAICRPNRMLAGGTRRPYFYKVHYLGHIGNLKIAYISKNVDVKFPDFDNCICIIILFYTIMFLFLGAFIQK